MIKVTDKDFWIHPYLKQNLDLLKKAIKHKWDGIVIVDGMEGSGKTTLGASMCYYMAYNKAKKRSSFNIDSFAWSPRQIEKAIKEAKPGSSVLCDEFVLAGLSTDAMTEMQNILIKYFTLIRKKRLFICLVIPYFYLLRRYFALGRPRALIHLFTPDGIKRGFYRFYNYEQKRYLYFNGIKTWSYPKDCDCSFIGESRIKSLEELGIDDAEYNRRKDKAINSIFEKKNQKRDLYKERFFYILGLMKKKKGCSWRELSKQLRGLNMSAAAMGNGYNRYAQRAEDRKEKQLEQKRNNFKMPNTI